MSGLNEHLSIKRASERATKRIGKTVTASNIIYLLNYGRVSKSGENGEALIALKDLADYDDSQQRETDRKKKRGDDLN